jgi:thioredoxin-dependent peroxiredoxin
MAQLGRPKRLALTLALLALVAAAGSAAIFLVFAGPVKRADGGSGLLAVGAAAPDFEGQEADGTRARLSDKSGQLRVVYFYPKDETPGCTHEACAFRDAFKGYEARGIAIFGVSADSAASHDHFRQKHSLPFALVADEDGRVQRAYGVSSVLGFASRVTFLVGADGNVARVWPEVDPGVHAAEVLAAADALGQPVVSPVSAR